MSFTLFHSPCCGSLVVLCALKLLNIQHEAVVLDYDETTARKDSPNLRRLLAANPLAQFPTLITPDGTVMTEMAAIVLYLTQNYARGTPWAIDALTPAQMAAFYRFMVFVPGNIYPMITYVEFPERFVAFPESVADYQRKQVLEWMRNAGTERRKDAFSLLEKQVAAFNDAAYGVNSQASKFVLGTPQPTMLDVLLSVVSHYAPHPRPNWLFLNCPRLFLAVRETISLVEVGDVIKNDGDGLRDIVDYNPLVEAVRAQ